MLTLTVAVGDESFNELTSEFVNSKVVTLEFEHSLASLSKWESKFEKPFLGELEKTSEESLFYIEQCMLQTKIPPEEFSGKLLQQHYDQIHHYINAKNTATWFRELDTSKPRSRQVITADVIFGWMTALRIPFDAQYWHLNRLFTVIRVCNEQTKQPKKMGRGEAARQQAALNAQRKAAMGTRG